MSTTKRCSSSTIPALLLSFLAAACQPEDSQRSEIDVETPPGRRVADALDRETADKRKARVSDIRYELTVDVHSSSEHFIGDTSIQFELAGASSDLTIDFAGGTVDTLQVNGKPVATRHNGYFIVLPAATLKTGSNTVDVAYRHPYSVDGTGLHRFVDPEDGLTYLYTYLWPYYANRLFPTFDQPNLKANISLNVLAPQDWTVVSTETGTPEPAADGARLWRFDSTPKMSTYVFSLHAGPYAVWEDQSGDVPLRLMARRSLAGFVAVEEWMNVTRAGLQHYGGYFDIAYPFGKYDQLIVPDFPIGAMENIAAVAFSERYVQRQESSRSERDKRASVILHEMAHMWFGNLVTHDWWNGLWLNESFATQMSAIAEAGVTEFDDTWHGFFTEGKRDAYRRDSRVTTHPIEMPVDSTHEFFSVFDDITYEKGASVLKQMEHLVGEDNYRRGVSAYLKEHAYGTTELADFIGHQGKSANMDLRAWSDEWLYNEGYNSLAIEKKCEGGFLKSLTVTQSAPPDYPQLRTHRIDVALYNSDDNGTVIAGEVIPATIGGERTRIEVTEEQPCPALVNPNHDDWAYARIHLDDDAVDFLDQQLANVPHALDRSIFLATLFDRAMSGRMRIAEYADRALQLAETEQNIRVIQQISASLVEAVDMMQRLRPDTSDALARLVARIEEVSLTRAHFAERQDLKRVWLNTYLGVASSEAGLGTATSLLDGQAEIDGIDVSADIRWQLLVLLSRHGAGDIEARLRKEAEQDPSDSGAKSLLTARAATPQAAAKASWLRELQNPQALDGLAERRAVLDGLFPASQTDLQLGQLPQILETLPDATRDGDPYFVSSYTSALLTPICREESTAMLQAALDRYSDQLDTTALRFLREAHQADRDCLALRAAQSP